MRAFRIIIVAFFLVIFVASNAFAGALAAAGKPETPRLNWKGRTITIAVSSSLTQPSSNIKIDSDVAGAITRSLQAWQNAADIEFVLENSDRQSLSPSGLSGDGVSLITIAQTPDNVLLFSKDYQAESAKTRVFYNRKGFITEADIVLNPFQQFSTDGTFGTFDLQATLTHEIGHLLGLRHSGVLGATMSGSLSSNGSFGSADFSLRTLAESDVSAVRDLYGTGQNDETCCAVIAGKINFASGRAAKNLRVWAEDSKTGRVMAQSETDTDGSFRVGGLPAARYALFWQKKDDAASIGELGTIKLETGETKILDEKISLRRSDVSLIYVGVNSQLTDSAVAVTGGREYTIYLGGRGLDANSLKVEFNSPFFVVSSASLIPQDFGDEVSVVSFVIKISPDASPGVYSIFTTGRTGAMASLIGALNIE